MGVSVLATAESKEKRQQNLIRKLVEELSYPEIRKIYLDVLSVLREGARIKDYLLVCVVRRAMLTYNRHPA